MELSDDEFDQGFKEWAIRSMNKKQVSIIYKAFYGTSPRREYMEEDIKHIILQDEQKMAERSMTFFLHVWDGGLCFPGKKVCMCRPQGGHNY
jgi:hypothetical protein